MNRKKRETLDKLFRASRFHMGPEAWENLMEVFASTRAPQELPGVLACHAVRLGLPDYLPELAHLELAVHEAGSSKAAYQTPTGQFTVNPTLRLLPFSWKHLPAFLSSLDHFPTTYPEKGEEFVLLWKHPANGELMIHSALDEDLLALKIVAEEIAPGKAAAEGHVSLHVIEAAIERAVAKGLLLAPASGIRRDRSAFPIHAEIEESALSTSVFTLQWHVTHACDLHCRHCYDRSRRAPIELSQSMALLDDFHGFCREHHVRGHISFTGGNPFLHPDFFILYRAAAERGFSAAILGNPVPGKWLEDLVAIECPVFFQVSLEGLPEHNDWIRGVGHFDASLGFLDLLREFGVYSIVMLTLTGHNIGQVLAVAEMLRGKTDLFTFNRLSLMGEGASLQLPSKDEYITFLHAYADAASDNPVLGLKDNLINIVRYRKGLQLFGGCSGYGCGAAFNFITVLPDGDAHACRKFQSPIGNVVHSSIAEVYGSEAARSYRAGCDVCRSCAIRHVCGGCLASAYSFGLNPLREKDPYCFIDL
ncbi:MAG: thio(seleno)oxazole modification radical SAM maturase SbtM [Syntrophobacteraceae bacterium]